MSAEGAERAGSRGRALSGSRLPALAKLSPRGYSQRKPPEGEAPLEKYKDLSASERSMNEQVKSDLEKVRRVYRQEGSFASDKGLRGLPLLSLRRPGQRLAAYGALRFQGSLRPPSKWAALAPDSDVDDVVGLLSTTWRLPQPTTLLSVTGAATDATLFLTERQRDESKRGLLEAVRLTKGWVVSGGTNGGVMGLVGKTMSQQVGGEMNVCLGIATFGIVTNHEELEPKDDKVGSLGRVHKCEAPSPRAPRRGYPAPPARPRRRVRGEPPPTHSRQTRAPRRRACRYRPDKVRRQSAGTGPRAPLEPNHSHFILVDDGTVGEFGKEIDLRAKLEDALCRPPVCRRLPPSPLPPRAAPL